MIHRSILGPEGRVCKKQSDEMIMAALSDTDGLYSEAEVQEAPPKRKKIKVDDKSVSDSISTVKTAISSVRNRSSNTNE